jgi:hypothetical protein
LGAVMQIIGGSLLFSTSNAPLAAGGPLNVVRFRDTEYSDIAASSSALCGVTAVTGAGLHKKRNYSRDCGVRAAPNRQGSGTLLLRGNL